MAKAKELREAFSAGAAYGNYENDPKTIVAEAKRRFPPKLLTRPREIQLPSREAAPLRSNYRYVDGKLEYFGVDGWQLWLNHADTTRLRELFFSPSETIEVDE